MLSRPERMRTLPVLHITASVIIALFLIQVTKRLTAGRSNPIAQGLSDGLAFLTS